MSSRSKETLAVQLFPFLAVLVCTMGSLIFLLLVTTQKIRQRAVAFAAYQLAEQQLAAVEAIQLPPPETPLPEPEKEPEVPAIVIPMVPVREPKRVKVPDQSYLLALADRQREVKDLEIKWKLRSNHLTNERDAQLALLARQKLLVDKALEQTKSAKTEVDKLEAQLGQIAHESVPGWDEKDDTERLLLEKQIAELKKKLRAAQITESTDNEKFQVVPFDPQTGTTRRPIFIECTENGIRFVPEDIMITAADLDGFTNRANPLAAGTGALINYWTAWNYRQRNPRSEAEPYVLMLVRPNGIVAYYAALRMLDPIRTAHGYELIEESTSLKLPEVDLGAKEACRAAVDRLLTERENIFREAVNNGSASTVFGGGGRIAGPGTARGSGSAKGSYSERMAEIRRAGGNNFTMNDVTGNDRQVGTRSWERVENFEGRSRRRRGADGTQDPDSLANGTTSGGGNANGTPFGGGDGSGQFPVGRQSSGAGSPTDNPSNGTGQQTGQTASGGAPGGTQYFGLQGNQQNAGNTQNGTQGSSQNVRGGASSASGNQNSTGSNGSLANNTAPRMIGSVPEMPVGQRPGKKRGSSSQTPDSQSYGDEGEPGDDVADGDGRGGPGGSNSQPGGQPNSSMLSDNPSSSPRHRNGSKLSSQSTTSNRPSKSSSDNLDRQLEPEMLSGRRWGFSEAGASIGFEREVRVDVSQDKLVIAEKYTVAIEPDDTKQETFEQFATMLDRYSHEWGRPPQGFFWTPRLKFVVKPEANAHYEQLNAMMTRAGVATSHEFAKDNSKVVFGRESPSATKLPPKTASHPASGGVR